MEKKLYIEIECGEEAYYYTLQEGLKLMNSEFRRIESEKKDFDGCPYSWDFKWMTEEEFAELTEGNVDRPDMSDEPDPVTYPLTAKQISDLFQAGEDHGYDLLHDSQNGKITDSPDKATYLKQHFNIDIKS